MRIPLAPELLLVALSVASAAAAGRSADPSEVPPAIQPHRFVIELAPGTPRVRAAAPFAPNTRSVPVGSTGIAALDAMNASYQPVTFEPMFPTATAEDPLSRFWMVELPGTASLIAALADYASVAGVAGAEPVPIVPVSYVPNDPSLGQQWQLGQPNDHDSDVFEAWDMSRGDSSVIVAILDTGVLYSHDDLGGSAAPHTAGNIAMNWIEMAGAPGVDDDLNGYVDDFRGWDFVAFGTGLAGEDLSQPDNDPRDFAGHGTFCAGMASARTDNGVGIAGTAFRCRILPCRVGWKDAASSPGQIDLGYAAQAIRYAVDNGAKVINCSWQSFAHSALGAAVTDAVARGVTVCVAAGNSNSGFPNQNYLGTRGDCVDVAAIDSGDHKAGFSNYGEFVDVAAAGVSVTSTWSTQYTPGYLTSGGTSVASPMVAGAVALYQSHRRSQGLPFAKPGRIVLRVRDTGDNIDALNPTYSGKLGGRLNVLRLLTDPPTSWTNAGPGRFASSPVIVDLDGDGDEEVVAGDADGRIVAVTGVDGDTLAGFPVQLDGAVTAAPAIGDLDRDGRPEIVVATAGGNAYAIRGDGAFLPGWPVDLGAAMAGPAVADVDRTSAGFEVAVGGSDGRLWVLDGSGAPRPGWPRTLGGPIAATPALHDFDADGAAEVVVGADDSTLYALHADGTDLAGWPVRLPGMIRSSAAIGDIDRDGADEIVVGCFDHHLHGLERDGTPMPGWPVDVLGTRCSPALADLVGNDGFLEVITASDGLKLQVFDHLGNALPGWPQSIGGTVSESVVVADVDGDGNLDIVAGTSDSKLHVYAATGAEKPGWPRTLDGGLIGSPSIGDPDHDGRAEIVIGTDGRRLHAIDMGPSTWNAAKAPWPTMHGDYLRRGSVSPAPPLVGVVPGPAAAAVPGLKLRALPNPVSTSTRLVARSSRAASDPHAAVEIYAVTGQRVRRLALRGTAAGEASAVWDGANDHGQPVPAGVYIACARWNGVEARQRLVRLQGNR